MGLPPTSVLLAPPRRSIDPVEWSRRHGERYCLIDIPRPQHRPARRLVARPLSPLKSDRRNSAFHVPMCVLPRAAIGDENAPVPIGPRVLRKLSAAKAEEVFKER